MIPVLEVRGFCSDYDQSLPPFDFRHCPFMPVLASEKILSWVLKKKSKI